MRISVAALVLSITLITTGCGINGNIKPGEAANLDSESSILLLRVTPAYRIQLVRGTMANGVWERPTVDAPEVNIVPPEGYIFVKVKPTTADSRLGVSFVSAERVGYGPCEGSMTPVFTLNPGTVTYVGDLHYRFQGTQLGYDYEINEGSARAFVKANYPEAAAAFRTAPMAVVKVKSTLCNPVTATIPIFVPSR